MFAFVVAIVVLIAAVGAIVLLLKNMGQEGVEIAAPGSCKSGRCGVACRQPVPGDEATLVAEAPEQEPRQLVAGTQDARQG